MIFNFVVKPIAFLFSNFQLTVLLIGINYGLIYQEVLLDVQQQSQGKIDPLSFVMGSLIISCFVFSIEFIHSMAVNGKTRYEDQIEGIENFINHIKKDKFNIFKKDMEAEYVEGWIPAAANALERRLKPHGNGYSESHK